MRVAIGVALLLTLAGSAVAQQAERIFPFDYRLVELENGFKAYLIEAGAPGQIAYVSMVRTGSRDEVEEGKSGFAHFFEHMMFRGTEKYPEFGRPRVGPVHEPPVLGARFPDRGGSGAGGVPAGRHGACPVPR